MEGSASIMILERISVVGTERGERRAIVDLGGLMTRDGCEVEDGFEGDGFLTAEAFLQASGGK